MAALRETGPAMVFLHAHPDDEAMLTGATLAKAHALGWRTIVVYATHGDAGVCHLHLGEETLAQRRTREATAACAELGVARIEWLGYLDSGMAGEASNDRPGAFGRAALDEVVSRLTARLAGEDVVAVVGYDANGLYGHPDHVQVHRVAHALAPALGSPYLIDATYHREYLASLPDSDGVLDPGYATAAAELTHYVQGERWFRAKMEAIKCHRSQAPPARRPAPAPAVSSGSGGSSSGSGGAGIARWRTRHGTEWFIVRPPAGGEAIAGAPGPLGRLGPLFDPSSAWPGPLSPRAPGR